MAVISKKSGQTKSRAQKVRLVNELLSTMLERGKRVASTDPRRDLNKECGYPESVTVDDCWEQFKRNGVAARVISIYPDECFSVDPVPYESESSRNTPFETSWETQCESDDCSPLHFMHRVDVLSGIGRYGALLLGVDDGKKLEEPLAGADDRDGNIPNERRLIYIRAFDERQARILRMTNDPRSPRHGKPDLYSIELLDEEGLASNTTRTRFNNVHWSRIIHVADNRWSSSENFGIPRMQPVFNRLVDVEKVLGPGAEMFYKGGFPGLSLELDPRIAEIMDTDIDSDSIDDEMYNYMNGLQRYLWLEGLNAKSLAPQVANPGPTLEALLNAIAMSGGYPLRIFMGSEQAQLASGQDVRTWNRRLQRRQNKYLTPLLVRPMIDRLIKVGVLRPPRKFNKQTGVWSFKVWWPDVNLPNADEQSQIADRRAACMMKYMQSQAYQVMQFRDFLRFVMGYDAREVSTIMKNAKKPPELKITPPQPKGGDSGVGGKPPSKASPKPRPGGRKD